MAGMDDHVTMPLVVSASYKLELSLCKLGLVSKVLNRREFLYRRPFGFGVMVGSQGV